MSEGALPPSQPAEAPKQAAPQQEAPKTANNPESGAKPNAEAQQKAAAESADQRASQAAGEQLEGKVEAAGDSPEAIEKALEDLDAGNVDVDAAANFMDADSSQIDALQESFDKGKITEAYYNQRLNELKQPDSGGEVPAEGTTAETQAKEDTKPMSEAERRQQISEILDDASLTPAQRADKINQLNLQAAIPAEQPTNQTNEQLVQQEQQLQNQLASGEITQAQYQQGMAELANQTGMGVSQAGTENLHPKGESYSVENATIHEPTAAEREAGAEVTELTPEQVARAEGVRIATELAGMGIDITTKEGQALAAELAKNPDQMIIVQKTVAATNTYRETFGTLATVESVQATTQSVNEQLADAESKGDEKKISKLNGLLAILAVIALALTAAVVVGPAATVIGGAVATGVGIKGAAMSG